MIPESSLAKAKKETNGIKLCFLNACYMMLTEQGWEEKVLKNPVHLGL